MSRPFLITGCGRSGTAWAATLLTHLGYPCGHEQQFNPWRAGPLTAPESSWLAVPHLTDMDSGIPLIRVMRDPYLVVRSVLARRFLRDLSGPYEAYVHTHRPDITAAPDHLGRAIRWATQWDAPLDNHPHAVLRVDAADPDHTADAIEWATGFRPTTVDIAHAVAHVGTRVNAGPRTADVRTRIDAHPDGHLMTDRAKQWGYV